MLKHADIKCSAKHINDTDYVRRRIAEQIDVKPEDIGEVRVVKRSIDARSKTVQYHVKTEFVFGDDELNYRPEMYKGQSVKGSDSVHIIGMGPAGIFAALRLIELGKKPILFEQGKPVEERKKDIASLHREAVLNADSNYAFGEGGAGTYSDGKLYTRSKKRGDRDFVLGVLHQFGASRDILIDSHPHIGTDKLSGIIKNIRKAILDAGGEIYFNTKIVSINVNAGAIQSVSTHSGDQIDVKQCILAMGHSASDMYQWFFDNNFPLEAKPFAMGVRVEHPQELINRIRYRHSVKNPFLPPAEYAAAVQTKDRGVYTFCMCPGGSIVPAMTEDQAIVVNGMSNSQRNSKWANSGLVTEVKPKDVYKLTQDESPLAGLKFQHSIERLAFQNSGGGISAPAQRMVDFCEGKVSSDLPESSYTGGLVSSPMHFWLPEFMTKALKSGMPQMNKNLRGFYTNEAVLVGVESRTSSPIRIPRDRDTFEYTGFSGLYPVGEGAGYAGGIVSSAIDGLNVAEKIGR
ncbi:MAG: FAD-binding protein [Bacteroidota bacterium]|nr:FAD-binding protein [Bacteroidota bacterium]